MVDVTIYVRNMDLETWARRLSIMSINDEPAMGHGPARYHHTIHRDEDEYYTSGIYPRYIGLDKETNEALTHLERMANGLDNVEEAILYVNHYDNMVRTIAMNFVKWGREAVWWKYKPNEGLLDDD